MLHEVKLKLSLFFRHYIIYILSDFSVISLSFVALLIMEGSEFKISTMIDVVILVMLYFTMTLLISVARQSYHLKRKRILINLFLRVSVSIILFDYFTARDYNIQLLFKVLIISVMMIACVRYFLSHYLNKTVRLKENAIIIGTGDAALELFNQLCNNESTSYNPIGFVDDKINLKSTKIDHSLLLGTIDDLVEVAQRLQALTVILAIPSATTTQINRVLDITQNNGLQLKALPTLPSIPNSLINMNMIGDLDPEVLLGRDPVDLSESQLVKDLLNGSVVFVSGGGGSIGSEVCMQACAFAPSTLVIFDNTELFLYEIEMKIKAYYPHISVIAVLGDVCSHSQVNSVIKQYQPSVIFHAAAYKHVPLAEENAVVTLKTNLNGTYNVARCAIEHGVPRFVLVSTDKAVNPTNVMGATKRAAELICQLVSSDSEHTKFMTVRFGNVLGSSGSVIPLFKRQIASGGPVTVTHPDITRYFMSIPEASKLILFAAAMGRGGELFVLDMGKPVKIIDLAKTLIRMSGLELDNNIKIQFTGLRKGEKMFEELLLEKEKLLETKHPKILSAKTSGLDQKVIKALFVLLDGPSECDGEDMKALLQNAVPEFTPNSV